MHVHRIIMMSIVQMSMPAKLEKVDSHDDYSLLGTPKPTA